MKRCIILGDHSDIAQGLVSFLEADGYSVHGWHRGGHLYTLPFWDLIIVAMGRVAPVGLWMDTQTWEWEDTMASNLLRPLEILRALWIKHNPNASVCWFAGSNPNMIMDGYSAYNVSKMAVLKAVEQLDHETPDCKFFALGPGIVQTKIHMATIEANWPNQKLKDAIHSGKSTPIEKIYDCLKWCVEQPKEIVGGRNICVSDNAQSTLPRTLPNKPNLFKLRRVE